MAEIVWHNFQEICEIQKTSHLKYVLAYAAREGIRYLNIREFYKKKTTGEWKPSMNGIAIPLVMPLLGAEQKIELLDVLAPFRDALENALVDLPNFAIYDEANIVYKEVKQK